MGRNASLRQELENLDCKEITVVYLENGEQKEETGPKEKIFQILDQIEKNPKTMRWKEFLHRRGS